MDQNNRIVENDDYFSSFLGAWGVSLMPFIVLFLVLNGVWYWLFSTIASCWIIHRFKKLIYSFSLNEDRVFNLSYVFGLIFQNQRKEFFFDEVEEVVIYGMPHVSSYPTGFFLKDGEEISIGIPCYKSELILDIYIKMLNRGVKIILKVPDLDGILESYFDERFIRKGERLFLK